MDKRSRETLRRVEQNVLALTEMWIGASQDDSRPRGGFASSKGTDYSKLGRCIDHNTRLTTLMVYIDGFGSIIFPNRDFVEGLRGNSTIYDLHINCDYTNIVGGIRQEILNAYQENNNLSVLRIQQAGLQNGGDHLIGDVLRRCTNLNQIRLPLCNISNEQIVPIVDAIRGHTSLWLVELDLNRKCPLCGNIFLASRSKL